MKQFTSKIISTKAVSSDLYRLEFSVSPDIKSILPGQFFTVRVLDSTVPFLRRPFAFSAFDAEKGIAQAIYKKRGMATQILAAYENGEELDIIAPLGNSFKKPETETMPILIAGGIGIGPILFFARQLNLSGINFSCILGWRSLKDAISDSELSPLPVSICTDDGSSGFKGNVVDYLKQNKKLLNVTSGKVPVMYACGPNQMLKACHEISLESDIQCFVSVEQVMACGVGACMGCAIKASNDRGYFRVCHDGPIFNSRDLEWI